MMLGYIITACATVAVLSRTQRVIPPPDDGAPPPLRVDGCTIALVFVASDPDSPTSMAVDAATGGGGISHVYLDPCRVDDMGRRVVIDYQPGKGVHWALATHLEHRPHARVELAGELGAEVYGCISAKLGEPFRLAPMLAGVDDSGNCSGLVVHCFPPAIRRTIRERAGKPGLLSPNELAAVLGVRIGETKTLTQSRMGQWETF